MGYPDAIRVHVTPHQRETLEFLVNRRLSDVKEVLHESCRGTNAQRLAWEAEVESLRALKTELQQAGT